MKITKANLIRLLPVLLLALAILPALPQGQPVPPTTAFTRSWLRSTNAGEAILRLGVGGPTNGVTAAQAEAVARNSGASGTNSFAGSGTGLTNVQASSVIKYISQNKPLNADSNWFGPWTTGTTTAGLQEAWDSAWKGTNRGPNVGGVILQVQEGYYFFTNALDFRTVYPFSTTIRGQNLLSTKLAYAGTNNGISTVTFGSLLGSSTNGGLNLPAHVTISDISFTAVRDMNTNILVEVKDYSDLNINRVNFTGWQALTNQVDGAGVSLDASSYAAVTGGGLVGLKVWRGPEHGTHLSSLYFMQLAAGGDYQNDHVYAEDLRFAHIGQGVNLWPTTSRYSLGACILREGGLESIWSKLHCYSSKAGFVLLEQAYDSPLLIQANFEDCTTPLASYRGNSRTPIAFMPNVYGDLGWDSGPVKVYCVSNTPNYGVITSLIHTNSVVIGTDRFSAASGQNAWEIKYNDVAVLQVDKLGAKSVGRMEATGPSSQVSTMDGTTGFSTTDGVNASEVKADGSASFATGLSGSTSDGSLFGEKLTVKSAGVTKFSFDVSAGAFRMNDEENLIPGVLSYDFTTGVLGFGEMNASKVTTAKVESGAGGPTITSGSGAPSASEPNGSIYLRTDGSTSTTLYVRISGSWVGK